MITIKEIYDIIRDLQKDAKVAKNNELYDKLLDIKHAVNELEEENRQLNEKLTIRYKITFNKDTNSFVINDDPNQISYCAVCYGNNNKLIPLSSKGTCRICEENWHRSFNHT